MIKEIRYKNFKALRDTVLPLGRFTLIVGANGTGKTTALKGLEFMQRLSGNDFHKIISADVKNFEDNVKLIVVWDSFDKYIVDWNVSQLNSETKIHENHKNNTGVPTDLEKQRRRNIVENFTIFSFDAEKISQAVPVSDEKKLRSDGGNLAGILDLLKDTEPEKWEELNDEIGRWFPEFDKILFDRSDVGKSIVLRTKFGQHKIKAEDLSDGTRLALAYLTLAYLPNPPKIVAFEEPEKGIHPRLLRNIQEAMDRLAYPENFGEKREPIQVIATTHSPYLLDLYKDRREEIVIANKDEKGVHFERLSELPHIEEILQGQDAPLGDVWFTGILGGVPVQP